MFSANITGTIQRIIHDNKKSDKDAMVKVVLAVSKQYSNDPKTSKIFPLITIWGYDAQYLRKYAGVGQMVTVINAEAEYFKNENKLDEDGNAIEQVSFKAGKVSFPKADIMKALVDAGVAEEGDEEEEEEEERPRRKKASSSRDKKKPSTSRSARRGRRDEDEEEDEDDDEEEEEVAPRRRKKAAAAPAKKKPARKAPARRSRDEDEDDDDDDDNYFDEDED